MINYDIYLFHYYSFVGLLNRLVDLHIEVKNYYIHDEDFYLKINRKYRKLVQDNFKDCKIVSKIGVINRIESLIKKPITLISLFVAIAFFINLSVRIYDINIIGDYPLIEKELMSFLNENGIVNFSKDVNQKKIGEVSLLLKEHFNDELEFIELKKVGATISLAYKKRRKNLVLEGKKGSLYATKDGVIKGFSLHSGVKNVQVYDFVKKGDLLVSEILITTNNEPIKVGTVGKVFASTFYYVEVNCKKEDDASTLACLLDNSRYIVSKNINSDDEYIESEMILKQDLKNGYLKVYYVLYEDITI